MSRIHSEEEYESKIDSLTTLRLFAPVMSTVLPLQSSAALAGIREDERRLSNLQLPFTSPYKMPSFVTKRQTPGLVLEDSDDVEDVVRDALDSLSIENLASELTVHISPLKRQSLSYRERSVRLVRHCSSWTLLNDTEENRTYYDSQGEIPS